MSIGVIIRLQNLPWSANSFDIRQFFKGLSIPEGGVHIVGGELGDAFIAFSSDEDARQAMMLSGSKLKEVQVSLLLSSRSEMQKVIEKARSVPTQQSLTSAPVLIQQQQKVEEPKTLKRSRSRSRSRSNRRDDRDRSRRRSRSRDRSRRRSRSRSRGRHHKDDDSRDAFRKAEEGNKSDPGRNGNLGGFVSNAALESAFPLLAGNPFGLLGAQLPFIDDRLTATVRNTLSALGALPQLPQADALAAARFTTDPRARRDISPMRSDTTPVFPPIFADQFNSKLGPAFVTNRPTDPSQVWLTQPQQQPVAPVLPLLRGNMQNNFQERQRDNNPPRSRFNDGDRDFNNFASDRRFTVDRDSRPSFQRAPRNEQPRSRFSDSRSRFNNDIDRKNEYRDDERLRKNDIGLCVELEDCPATSFKEIERAFAAHDVVIDDVRFSGQERDRRVGVKVMGRMSKSAALQISGRLEIAGKAVNIHDLPENEYFGFRLFRDPTLEAERRRSGDGPRGPMRRRFDNDLVENGNNFKNEENTFKNEGKSFRNEENTFKNEGKSFKNEGNTFRNEENTFKNEGKSFKNEGNTFRNEGNNFRNEGNSFKNDGTNFKNDGNNFKKEQNSFKVDIVEEEKKKVDEPPVATAAPTECVFISSLPTSISDRDLIDFFSDIGLTPKKINLMLDDNREPLGQAYVEFHTAGQAEQACEKNGAPMGRFTVNVKLASRNEMDAAKNKAGREEEAPKQPALKPPMPLMQQPAMAPLLNRPIYPLIRPGAPRVRPYGSRPSRPSLEHPPPLPEPDRVVTMANIPYRSTIDHLLQFFGDSYGITPDDVFRKLNDRNQPTSDARVVMRTAEDALRAVNTLNNTKIWDRAITLRLLKHEME